MSLAEHGELYFILARTCFSPLAILESVWKKWFPTLSEEKIFHFNLLLWNPSAKWTKTWYEASMEGPLYRLLILSRSINKLGQMNRNLVGSIYGRSSIKIAHLQQVNHFGIFGHSVCIWIELEISKTNLNLYLVQRWLVYGHFHQYFNNMEAASFIGGKNQSARGKPPTCRKSLTNFITLCCIEYSWQWVV
jgi:hypothetical protein